MCSGLMEPGQERCKLLIGGTYGGINIFNAIIYLYKSMCCNDYSIELGPPIICYKTGGYQLTS
jgi:hypothetical protein